MRPRRRLRCEFANSLDDTAEHSDTDTVGIRLRQTWRVRGVEWFNRLRGAIGFAKASADLDYLGYTASSLNLQARLPFSKATFSPGLTFEDRNYDEDHPSFGETREDETIEFTLRAFRDISPSLQGTASLALFNRDSSIDYYACNGVMLTIGFFFLP